MSNATIQPQTEIDRERIAYLLAEYRNTIVDLADGPKLHELERQLNDEAYMLILSLLGEEKAEREGLV